MTFTFIQWFTQPVIVMCYFSVSLTTQSFFANGAHSWFSMSEPLWLTRSVNHWKHWNDWLADGRPVTDWLSPVSVTWVTHDWSDGWPPSQSHWVIDMVESTVKLFLPDSAATDVLTGTSRLGMFPVLNVRPPAVGILAHKGGVPSLPEFQFAISVYTTPVHVTSRRVRYAYASFWSAGFITRISRPDFLHATELVYFAELSFPDSCFCPVTSPLCHRFVHLSFQRLL